jgi:hypothetical protein
LKKEQEIKSDDGKVIVPAKVPTLDDYDTEYEDFKDKLKRMQDYQAGIVVQSKDFGNYDMGRGKCRLNGATTNNYKITSDEHLNVAACALDCDMDFNCKAFHYYTKDRMKGRGACVIWYDDGLTPNKESDSDCYMKKSTR